VRNELGAR